MTQEPQARADVTLSSRRHLLDRLRNARSRFKVALAGALTLSLALGTVFVGSSTAQAAPLETVIDGMTFQADSSDPDRIATLVSCAPTPTSTELSIPSSVTFTPGGDFYWVHAIAPKACQKRGLTSVSFPAFLRDIGDYAFFENSLTSLDLPNFLNTVGASAFTQNNIGTLDLTLTRVTHIGEHAFAGNGITGNVEIPSTVTSIGDGAFRYNAISSVTLPSLLTIIPAQLFMGNQLTHVSIPNTVTTIGSWAFGENPLTQVDIPTSVKRIEAVAFARTELTEITIPASVEVIQAGAFAAIPSLHTIRLEGNAPQEIREASTNGTFGEAAGKTVYVHREATGYSTTQGLWAGYELKYLESYVTFDSQGGSSVQRLTVNYGEAATKPSDPTRNNYAFTGWFTDSATTKPYNFATPVIDNLALYAGWKIAEYQVTFDSQGGSAVTAETVDHGKKATEPVAPTREGHTFTGWYTDKDAKTKYDFATPVTGALTLYAGWSLNTYTVTFDSQGGSAVTAETVDHGKAVTEPASPSKAGYTFTGWYTDKDAKTKYDFATPVTGALTLYAGWSLNTYTVTFDSQGGSAVTAETVDHGKKATEPVAPTREGHTFTGWYTDKDAKTKYDFAAPVTGALTLYAGWKIDTYKVTFDSQGGSAVAASSVEHGSPVQVPAEPSKKGHTFAGWYTDIDATSEYDFDTPVTAAVTLFAGWSVDTYEVTFATHGGSEVASVSVAYGDLLQEPAAPTREHYSFAGWHTDAETSIAYDFAAPVSGPMTLHAAWKIDTVSVTYDTRGGSSMTTESVDYGARLVVPGTPQREGYVFTGWFTDEATTVKYDFATPVTEPFTLYAGWKTIEGGPGANGTDANGKGNAEGPTPPSGLTHTGSSGVPLGVFIGVGAIALLGAALAIIGARKRKRTPADDQSAEGEGIDSM